VVIIIVYLLSYVYQQASALDPTLSNLDVENQGYHWRSPHV